MPRPTRTPLPILAVALGAILAASPALATREYVLPTLFDVARVAADDVLNIRAEPDADAPVIGTLAPDATRIEVVEERAGWARINAGEGTGWVNARHLDHRTDVWPQDGLPEGWRCFGTEPFWDVSAQGVGPEPDGPVLDGPVLDRLVLDGPAMTRGTHAIGSVLSTGAFRDPTRVVLAEGLTVASTPQICSDGMSDRLFGLRALVILRGGPGDGGADGTGAPRLLDGCCTIAP